MFERMKKRFIEKVVMFMLISVVWVSCSLDKTESFNYIPDVFQINQVMGNDTVHALAAFVYSDTEMSSASFARSSDLNNEIEMGPYLNSLFVMAFEPQDDDFKSTQDTAGVFLFTINLETGMSVRDSDYFNPQGLAVPDITELSFSQQQNLVVKWDDVEDAQVYNIKVTNTDGIALYYSNDLIPSTNELTLDGYHGAWITQPTSGETCTVQVRAILYEDGVNPVNADYNIEEVSIGEEDIVWE